jgi:hypothetical protein
MMRRRSRAEDAQWLKRRGGAYCLDPVTPRSARLPRLVCVSPTCVYAAIGQHGPLWVTPDLCVPQMRTTMAPGRGRYGQRTPARLLLLPLLLPPCPPLLAHTLLLLANTEEDRGTRVPPLGIKLTHSGYGNRSFMYHRDIPSM